MNELKRIDAFKKILADYKPSEEAKQLLVKTRLVLLVGPSSSGKNTIINELIKSDNYHLIVSDTTRQPRVNNGILEHDGREYWFRQEIDLLHDLEAGKFLEASVIHEQQVSGVSIRELAAAAEEGRVAINEIEVVGADNIHAAKPDAQFIFILPPSFDEWMARMNIRGELPTEEVKRRMTTAVIELTMALERDYYHFVVNDTFMHTAERINDMIMNDAPSDESQAASLLVARQLLEDTKAFLAQLT